MSTHKYRGYYLLSQKATRQPFTRLFHKTDRNSGPGQGNWDSFRGYELAKQQFSTLVGTLCTQILLLLPESLEARTPLCCADLLFVPVVLGHF